MPDEEITVSDIHRLVVAGQILSGRYLQSRALLRNEAKWRQWARLALLALGVGQLIAAVIFFFAFNWAEFPDIGKFAAVEILMIFLAGTAILVGFDRPLGQAAGIAAFVSFGVLLAVVGQVYQTGADSWTLFAIWAGLALPFLFGLRSAIGWLAWLVVALLAINLYAEQVLVIEDRIVSAMIPLLLALIITVAFIAREFLAKKQFQEAGPFWIRLILLAAVLTFWTVCASGTIFDSNMLKLGVIASVSIPVSGFIVVCVAALRLALRTPYDMPALTMIFLALSVFFSLVLGRALYFVFGEDFSGLFMVGLAVMGIFGGAAVLLLRLSQTQRRQSNDL